jgi:hypothetical protein
LPYTVEKTFTKVTWKVPIFLTPEPETEWLWVVQTGDDKDKGPSKILRVRDDPQADRVETFLELRDRLIYSVAFHPGYRTNGHIYLFTHGSAGEFARTNRISRFTVGRQAPHQCDPQSERVIIEWRSEGHDGGGIVFGRDGMLYISTGDGTADSDGWVSGQDLSELLGGVLRIDVDHPEGTQAYSVPGDNPFVGMPNVATGELGLRFEKSVASVCRSKNRGDLGRQQRPGPLGNGSPHPARGELRLERV